MGSKRPVVDSQAVDRTGLVVDRTGSVVDRMGLVVDHTGWVDCSCCFQSVPAW